MKKGGNRKEGTRRGRSRASTSSASKNDDAIADTVEDTTQETQPTQETEEAAKVESPALAEVGENKEEAKENQESENKQVTPSSSRQQEKDPNDGASSSQLQAEVKKEKSENQEEEDEQPEPDSSTNPNAEEIEGASSSQLQQAEEVKTVGKKRGRPTKRKRSIQKELEQLRVKKKEEGSSSGTRAKRARTTKMQESEPEYFKEKRSLEDLWKVAFPAGTEWDQLDALYKFNWDFTNLEQALEEGGELYGKKVYVFGCTESHLVTYKSEKETILVPAVVCIESSIPPADKIGITSVESKVEQIVPMKDMKMAWTPYTPLEKRDRNVARMKFQIFTLGCTQRRSALKNLKDDRVKKFKSCLPYIDNPFKEDESEQNTVVQITFPSEPPVVCEYDWSKNDIEEFTNDLIIDETLPLDKKDEFQEFVEEQREKAQKAIEEARQAREEAKEGMSEETKEAYKEMKLYKFYPLPSPDLSGIEKSPFINKYFGKAHEVV